MIQLEKFSAGHFEKGQGGYSYFVPVEINRQWNWTNQEINYLLEKAAIRLGELNSYARLVPNIDLFIQLHVTKEAVVSSRIEGTRTNMYEALMTKDEIAHERKNDWKEVNNYIGALNQAIEDLENLPISSRLIKQTHYTLLDSVRGKHKSPGDFRRSQNWIGGSSPSDAVFVPPHHQYIESLMGDLEKFLHNDDIKVPDLIRIAIAHYQFETIHPFLDGNGRIGRLLITLYLVERKILSKPLLYLSSYFEKNRSHYYDNLTVVRSNNDMTQWVKYFLTGVSATAENAVATLSDVIALKYELETLINQSFGRKSHSAVMLLQQLFQNPVINIQRVKDVCRLSFKSANNLVTDFMSVGILKEMTGQSRNRMFVFENYLDLFMKEED